MPGKKECSFVGCKSPHNSRQFYQIDGRSEAGGQDWTELAGAVLCHSCYMRFSTRGRLERTRNEPLCGSARRCSYEGCKSPHNSSKFIQIDGRSEAGGQDWTELGRAVLCNACYNQFFQRGTLERTAHRGESLSAPARQGKKRKASHEDIEDQRDVDSSSSSSSSGKKPRKKKQEQEKKEEQEEDKKVEEEEEYDGHLEQCFMCFGSGTRVCIVPCGHSICGGCVEEGLLKISKTRPFSECPVCREEMCEPWVMEGDLWVELGGTPFDP